MRTGIELGFLVETCIVALDITNRMKVLSEKPAFVLVELLGHESLIGCTRLLLLLLTWLVALSGLSWMFIGLSVSLRSSIFSGRRSCLSGGLLSLVVDGTGTDTLEDHEMEGEIYRALLIDLVLFYLYLALVFMLSFWTIHEFSRLFDLHFKCTTESGLVLEQLTSKE